LFAVRTAYTVACPCCQGCIGRETLSGSPGAFAERLLLFLLACLLRLLRLLRFLSHNPLRGSLKLGQCKSTLDVHAFSIHHNCKFDTAGSKEGKRRCRALSLRAARSSSGGKRIGWRHR